MESLPVREGEPAERTPRTVPQIEVPLSVPERPEHPTAALPDPVDREGRHGRRPEHIRQMVAAVAEVALKTAHVPGLERFEGFAFNGPSASGAAQSCRQQTRFRSSGHPTAH